MLAIISFPQAFFSSPARPKPQNPFPLFIAPCTRSCNALQTLVQFVQLYFLHVDLQFYNCTSSHMYCAYYASQWTSYITCCAVSANDMHCSIVLLYFCVVVYILPGQWSTAHSGHPPLSTNRLPKDRYSERTPLLKVILLVIRILITLLAYITTNTSSSSTNGSWSLSSFIVCFNITTSSAWSTSCF